LGASKQPAFPCLISYFLSSFSPTGAVAYAPLQECSSMPPSTVILVLKDWVTGV